MATFACRCSHVLCVPPLYGGSAMIQMSEPALALKSAPSKPLKKYDGHSLTTQGTNLHCEASPLAHDITHCGLQPAPLDAQHILCCKKNSAKIVEQRVPSSGVQ